MYQHTFLSPRALEERFYICHATVYSIIRLMKESGKYPDAVIQNGMTRIDADAFEDAFRNRARLRMEVRDKKH